MNTEIKILAELIAEKLANLLNHPSPAGLLDRHEMAQHLKISVATLDRMTKANSIPSVLIGSRRLFDPSAVVSALNGSTGDCE